MAIPRVKTCSSDTMNEIGKAENAKPALRKTGRPSGIIGVKSKIPKHEKPGSAAVTTSAGEAIASKSQDSGNKRALENQFNTKRKHYATLRKEIDEKEKYCLTMYEEIQQLREKMMAGGGKDPVAQELLQAPATASLDLLTEFETSLSSIPDTWLGVCREALEKRNAKLLSWIETLEPADGTTSDSLKEELTQRIASFDWNEESAELSEQLREQVQKMSQLVQRLRLQLERSKCGGDSTEKVDRAERERGLKTRARVRELETQLRELQEKLKQKETSLELKSKELHKCQKSNEAARGEIAKVDKQRENQESKLAKLKQEVESKDKESRELIAQYNKQVQHLQQELEDERKTRQELQSQFDQFKARNVKLEEKCQQLLEVQEKEKNVLSVDGQHTEYEIQLFDELRETQKILAEKSEIIRKLEAEREKILAAAVNAPEDETGKTDENSREIRLAAELLTKTDELDTLRDQFKQLQKNYRRMQQRAEYFEEKLKEMNEVQNQLLMKEGSGSRAAYGAQVMQLHQQVTDLRSSLAQANGQNVELEKTCMRLQLKLERYKRHMHNLNKDRKLRKEMQTLLQHEDAGMVGAESHLDVQNTAEDIEELYEALEKKELQVMKLEKLVKQMEQQEECSQAQRTRLENRIAKLELELKEAQQTHRNRGFSFL
ncbi:myosin heavy chain, embryonic smooth muscle isoform isoform X2 [Nasonia vitripennis]|uniref:Uncharacterized protein n=1 Tax=Nasonia vitripennis TaxID=7425 RepID=A0A7M7QB67_NASVI|nr:myosin heavy chain, embryonic smooth muscle isoform isoform X2 [Nasonia vitripennis]